jgi:tetratricopeptide (TPR) repeat protein
LAVSLWWLGENQACVDQCSHAYVLFRRSGDVEGAARCAVWLAITYKANFANFSAANGWIRRAERLVASLPPGPLHGWLSVARAYRMADLNAAESLTAAAVELAQSSADVDLELVALSQLGLVKVAKGETSDGFALIDEAMAAALAGERSTLDTVVYTCCDMLNACELASDMERAAQWCKVADEFVTTYGCPFLYAECRIYYGSVLAAKGRWDDAERELVAGLRITDGACPGLHAKALTRLAALRIRQGRLEEADQLLAHLGEGVDAEADETLSVSALLLARGDAPAAGRLLEHRLQRLEEQRSHLVAALDLLVDAHLTAGDVDGAAAAARGLAEVASSVDNELFAAMAAGATGRVVMRRGDPDTAATHLEVALRGWSRLERPFELARTRFELARALAQHRRDDAIDHARSACSPTGSGRSCGSSAPGCRTPRSQPACT